MILKAIACDGKEFVGENCVERCSDYEKQKNYKISLCLTKI